MNPLRSSARFALWIAAGFTLLSLIALAIVAVAPFGERGFFHYLIWAYTSLPTLFLFRLSESDVIWRAPNLYSLLVITVNAMLAGVAGFLLTLVARFVKRRDHDPEQTGST